ncbi:hypothetical protein BC938DRAFT_475369 [Jimgerdemannia flammicorona]|uniref:Aminoacyl-tRNA synthetase class II (D/K/N) domain-containing protein n=1 Tax=Jimgerdemannia flammicorona TaxID=994334 RepID=A0A433QRL9_9FUNG|nr:hypothetical protein BC938DRAFT_475369 [Jimgerdemannia flammicorona]
MGHPQMMSLGLCERFKCFVATKEITNAYTEQNDPFDQQEMFAQQAADKAASDDETQLLMGTFVRALSMVYLPIGGWVDNVLDKFGEYQGTFVCFVLAYGKTVSAGNWSWIEHTIPLPVIPRIVQPLPLSSVISGHQKISHGSSSAWVDESKPSGG